jgi:hypothetical protein
MTLPGKQNRQSNRPDNQQAAAKHSRSVIETIQNEDGQIRENQSKQPGQKTFCDFDQSYSMSKLFESLASRIGQPQSL